MTTASTLVVLAHGGGAPEAAMVGLPLLVLVVFAVLERRARRREAAQEHAEAQQRAEEQPAEAQPVEGQQAEGQGAGEA